MKRIEIETIIYKVASAKMSQRDAIKRLVKDTENMVKITLDTKAHFVLELRELCNNNYLCRDIECSECIIDELRHYFKSI